MSAMETRVYGEFVERIIQEGEDKVRYQLRVKEPHQKIDEFITKICKTEKVSIKELKAGRRRRVVWIQLTTNRRAIVCM